MSILVGWILYIFVFLRTTIISAIIWDLYHFAIFYGLKQTNIKLIKITATKEMSRHMTLLYICLKI